MGELNVKAISDELAVTNFVKALLRDLKALEIMIEKGMIESGIQRFGVEQELCMIDRFWRPAPIVLKVLEEIDDPHFTTELANFNIEFNLDPLEFTGNCFTQLEKDLNSYLARLRKVTQKFGANVILSGILPTIRSMDLEMEYMTPMDRYKALFDKLREMRGGLFEYHIQGSDELIFKQEYPSFEFCNTSFQMHFQVKPENFVDAYNFSKLITAPALAAATNSPLLFGKRLWRETRIAIFQQAIDTRNISHHLRQGNARVSFSKQWIRNSILEVFQDDVARFRLLLYADVEEDSLKVLEEGRVPQLTALRIFNGTVYRWNRACYGIYKGKPHIRIENRVFPSGPTVVDEVANAAFWLGMMNAIPPEYEGLPRKIKFDHAVDNFINAARIGLDSHFWWLEGKRIPARELILKELLPIAKEGLAKARVSKADIKKYLTIIEERVKRQKTGAHWMLDSYTRLKEKGYGDESLVAITAGIASRQKEGIPVHKWKLAEIEEAGSWINNFGRVEQIMETDLFTVQKSDLIDLVVNIMDWKNIRHVPVEDNKGRLLGLITSGMLIKYYANTIGQGKKLRTAGDIMIENPLSVSPETYTIEAIEIMQKKGIGCLPVVKKDKLVGIVTEHDFMRISARLLQEIFDTPSSDS